MKAEKVILSFLAIVIGVLVAGFAFYLYQATKTIPDSKIKTVTSTTTPTPSQQSSSVILTIDSPKDEEVLDKKTITIAGRTNSDAIILISVSGNDQVITPASTGSFSATATLDDGTNIIEITAIAPNGEETTLTRTVTFTTESF